MRTPRPLERTRWAIALIAIATSSFLAFSGCDPRPLMFFLQSEDPTTAAVGPSLKGKKVVILVQVAGSAAGVNDSLDRDLGREVAKILHEKVSKIKIVPMQKVTTWVEGNPSWSDPAELAKKFEADEVIFLEVESFSIANPADLQMLRGTARVHVQVIALEHPKNSKGKAITDQPKESIVVFDEYTEPIFPKNAPISRETAQSEAAFLRKFTQLVATEITWNFVNRPIGDDIQNIQF